MDNFKYDINQEIEDIVDDVTKKFNYDEDMKMVLGKIIRATVGDKPYEDRHRLYCVLQTTPIVVLDSDKRITQEELSLKMGGNVNPHIKDKETFDQGEYGKADINGAGAFVSEPILDEDLNIIGIKKYIYVDGFDKTKPLNDQRQRFLDLFGTGINVPHLIHELGHAYVSEENPYSIEGNIVTQRMGVCTNKYKITPLGNGQYESEQISNEGIFIEEGLNTNFEEETLAKYLGLSLEETQKLYGDVFPSSFYQIKISSMTRNLVEIGLKQDIDKWRTLGDKQALERCNTPFYKANFYEKRHRLFERMPKEAEQSNIEIIAARNKAFNHIEKADSIEKDENGQTIVKNYEKETLEKIEPDFFPETENMMPMDMINAILLQLYDLSVNKYSFTSDKYGMMLAVTEAQCGGLIMQAQQNINKEKGINPEEQTQ